MIAPSSGVARLQASWHVVVLFGILGGVFGWGVSLLRPTEYESAAVLGIGIDFGRTHPLTKGAQRHALNRIRGLLLSDDVLEDTLSELSNESQVPDGMQDLRSHLSLEERESSWSLVVRTQNPHAAADWANIWAENAVEELANSISHALKAQEIQRELFEVGCELRPSQSSDAIALWNCSFEENPTTKELSEELIEEARLSRGIIPAISYSVLQEAQPSTSPALGGRGAWIALGTLLGILSGTAIIVLRR